MDSAFVSFSTADQGFVNLLVALLDYHGVDVWCSSANLRGGDNFRNGISQALRSADALLVVTTASSAGSKWVTKEIATFQEAKPQAPIVPLRLAQIEPREVLDDLQDRQWIDFTECMLEGFRGLMALFGRDFLATADVLDRRESERRSRGDRRSDERREGDDRRKATALQRMRKGFWKAFEDKVRVARFDEISPSVRTRLQIYEALRPEASRYVFSSSSGAVVENAKALEDSLDRVWEEVVGRGIHKAIYVVESIAEDIVHRYKVDEIERRDSERRSSDRRSEERRD